MSNKKIERALYGPSTTEVALGAVLGMFVGMVAAVGYLVFKPVSKVRELPAEPSVGEVYYLTGSEGTKGRGWEIKQSQLFGGMAVALSEEELNAWASTMPAPATDGFIAASKPNFRVIGDQLQIGAPVKLNYFGMVHDTVAFASGDFKKSGNTVVFSPEKVYLGSFPLHLVPGASGVVVSQVVSQLKFPDELRSAWARVDGVTISDGLVEIALH
jgi:hypothetical protein